MINKLVFFGCSITAGNELYEEAHIPNYNKMSLMEARKASNHLDEKDILEYQIKNSFPFLTSSKLGINFENCAISGISNIEIASRAITHFPNSFYDDVMAIVQITTHNRLFVKYKEDNDKKIAGSFIIHPQVDNDRLTKRQNNIIKENFLEFYEESLQIYTDQTFLFFAIQNLIKKNIPTFLIYGSKDMAAWPEWGGGEGPDKIKFNNDKDPQFMYKLFNYYADMWNNYDILKCSLDSIVPANSHLPRYHYNHVAHDFIATKLAEAIKCSIG